MNNVGRISLDTGGRAVLRLSARKAAGGPWGLGGRRLLPNPMVESRRKKDKDDGQELGYESPVLVLAGLM